MMTRVSLQVQAPSTSGLMSSLSSTWYCASKNDMNRRAAIMRNHIRPQPSHSEGSKGFSSTLYLPVTGGWRKSAQILQVNKCLFSNFQYTIHYSMWNEMKSLLSLEGLRPPLSRDSSTYTHAMSYFGGIDVRDRTSAVISKISRERGGRVTHWVLVLKVLFKCQFLNLNN